MIFTNIKILNRPNRVLTYPLSIDIPKDGPEVVVVVVVTVAILAVKHRRQQLIQKHICKLIEDVPDYEEDKLQIILLHRRITKM